MELLLKSEIPESWLDRSAQEPGNDIEMTLCTNCERAVRGRCPWREEFKPYPGWKATERTVTVEGYYETRTVSTYKVEECPGYVPTYKKIKLIRQMKLKKKYKRRPKWKLVKTQKRRLIRHVRFKRGPLYRLARRTVDAGKPLLVRQVKLKKEHLNEVGDADLAEAVMKQAKRDYIVDPHQRKSIETWMRTSMWFTDPEPAIRTLRDMARIVDLHPEKKKQILTGISDEELEQRKQNKPRRASWRIYNFGTPMAFAECSNCGHEVEMTEKYPRHCPACRAGMKKEVVVADD